MKFIATNQVRLTALVASVLAVLVGFDIVDWTEEQTGLILGAVGAFLVLFISPTVTSNYRLTGHVFGPMTGVKKSDVN